MGRKFGVIVLVLLAVNAVGLVFAHVKFTRQETQIKDLLSACQALEKKVSEEKPAEIHNITNKERYDDSHLVTQIGLMRDQFTKDLESLRKELLAAKASGGAPVAEALPANQTEIERVVADVMKKRDEAREAERDQQNRERMGVNGVNLISTAVPDLTEAQKEAIKPFLVDYAIKTQRIWWRPATDDNGKPLTFDEQVRRSDEIRAGIYVEIKKNLTPQQASQFDNWINERKVKISKGERTEGQGPFQWF